MLARLVATTTAVLALGAGVAQATVTYNGHPVRVIQVGAISASPCNDPDGCIRGIIRLGFRHHHTYHHVRCGHPRRLHVMSVFRQDGVPHVAVWACRRAYDWRLPR
jgi:hypothetical protein